MPLDSTQRAPDSPPERAAVGGQDVQGKLHGQQLPALRQDGLSHGQDRAPEGLLLLPQRLLQMCGMQFQAHTQGRENVDRYVQYTKHTKAPAVTLRCKKADEFIRFIRKKHSNRLSFKLCDVFFKQC